MLAALSKKFKNVDNIIFTLYGVIAAAFVLLLLYIGFNIQDEIYSYQANPTYTTLKANECTTISDASAPLGVKNQCTLELEHQKQASSVLMFYVIHQSVEVYHKGELLYSLKPDSSHTSYKTPGNNWIIVPILEEHTTLQIILTPAYETSINIYPEFYYGNEHALRMKIISNSILTFIVSALAIIVGLIFIGFKILTLKNPEFDSSLIMMGLFSVNIGLWKLTDLSSNSLLFAPNVVLSYIPFISLLLVIIPFSMYIKSILTTKIKVLWNIPCIVSILISLTTLLFQILGIYDFREMLIYNHLLMLFVVIIAFITITIEIKLAGLSRKLKISITCIGLCFLGLVIDLIFYYYWKGTYITVLGILAFLIYIITLGVISIKDARKLMVIGSTANHFQEMAFHDQLTGLLNRTAYAEHTANKLFDPNDCIIVMCDLNNLKKCNDTYGHDKGDNYIKTSAAMIQQCFSTIGNCYRMGGDEFCVLIKNASISACETYAKKLEKDAEQYTKNHPEEFPIKIACGYTSYDASIDYDIGDTLRRADKKMYQDKINKKTL